MSNRFAGGVCRLLDLRKDSRHALLGVHMVEATFFSYQVGQVGLIASRQITLPKRMSKNARRIRARWSINDRLDRYDPTEIACR